MAKKSAVRRFSAFVEPHGIWLIEYESADDGILLLHQTADPRRVPGLADAGERLGALIGARDSARATVSVVLRGFGSVFQLMTLPPADPAVLGSVVRREIARLHPDLDRPRVEFALGGEADRRLRRRAEVGHPQQEVLVGAAPGFTLAAFGEELKAAGLDLIHATLLPEAVLKLYQQSGDTARPTACYFDLAGGPMLAFFHEAQLRLFAEPPFGSDLDVDSKVQVLRENLDRGNLYFRQTYRGSEIERLWIAVDAADEAAYMDALKGVGCTVAKFPGPAATPGALVAVGGVLDADSTHPLNLSPFAESPESIASRRRRTTLFGTAAAVAIIAIVWATIAVVGMLRLSSEVQSRRTAVEQTAATLAPIREVAEQRQKSAQFSAYLAQVRSRRMQTNEVLRAIARATPPGVRLNAVSLDRTGDEWKVSIAGSAFGETGADVLLGVDRFFHGLPREVPIHDLVLSSLDDVGSAEFNAAMKFSLTFMASAAPQAVPPTAP